MLLLPLQDQSFKLLRDADFDRLLRGLAGGVGFCGGIPGQTAGDPGGLLCPGGEQADLIDDVTGTLPPYDQFIVLGPRDPAKLVGDLHRQTGYEVAIVDANDLGEVKLLAATSGVQGSLVKQALRKNPAGNAAEQTPLVLIRKMTPD